MSALHSISKVSPTLQWGLTTAPKRALLLHGLAASGQMWYYIAEKLVEHGYHVIAPDLLGHGLAPLSPTYKMSEFAKPILPLLNDRSEQPFDLIIGHSMGALVALYLLQHLSGSRPSQSLILVDPPLELADDLLDSIHEDTLKDAEDPERLTKSRGWMNYPEADSIWKIAGVKLCKKEAFDSIFAENRPWSFTHLIPPTSPSLKITVLAADPLHGAVFTELEGEDFKKARSDVKVRLVQGATHSLPREVPFRDVIVEEALALEG